MNPSETGVHYDQIARRWQQETRSDYGVDQLCRAMKFTKLRGPALDVGCGSTGRFIEIFRQKGFQPEGVDVSKDMIALAQERNPDTIFYEGEISEWLLPKKFALISAWDSTFHLPLDLQRPVLEKLCAGLLPGGVLIFTCGGGAAGEISGSFWGQEFGYSTLGVESFVQILSESGCQCRHVEYDQFPENHVYVIAQKIVQ